MKFGRLQNGLIKAQPETAPSNFISNPTPLKDTTGWSLYSDAAGTAPVDGTGGSPTVTWTRTTSSPLSETASFLFTKPASNVQGQGVSYDFTVNHGDKSKVCRIDFDYEVASGTYADGDLTVWLYDVTNGGAPIQPSASSILNAIGPQKKQSLSFQTNSNSTSYRLIIHVTSTSASAYTVKFDNVSVTRESAVGLSPVSAKAALSGNQSVASSAATKVLFNTVSFNYGGMYDATNSRFMVSQPGVVDIQASLRLSSVNAAEFFSILIYQNGSQVYRMDEYTDTTSVFLEGGDSYEANSGDVFEIYVQSSGDASYQIDAGTSSKVTINMVFGSMLSASDADTRVVAAEYYGTASTVTNAGDTVIVYNTKVIDSVGAYDTATGKYNVQIPGQYRVSASFETAAITSGAVTSPYTINIKKNGTTEALQNWPALITASVARVATITSIINANAGDYIEIVGSQQLVAGAQSLSNSNRTRFSIERISGPAQIAPSEQILVKAQNGAGTSFTGGAGYTDIPFATEVYDSHGSFATPLFTAPAPGYYEMTVNLYFGAVNLSTSQAIDLQFVNNGTAETKQIVYGTGVSRQFSLTATDTYYLLAGQTLKARTATDVTASLVATAARNYVTIKRLGGVG